MKEFRTASLKLSATEDVDNQPQSENPWNYVTDDSEGREAKK